MTVFQFEVPVAPDPDLTNSKMEHDYFSIDAILAENQASVSCPTIHIN
jgi:hypothetical protein